MKFGPRQILGVVAILVFGGYFIYLQTKPKPDPFTVPGALPMNDAAASAPPAPAEITPPANPLEVGSQEARDDLYCSGVIYVAHRASGDTTSADATKRRAALLHLAEIGTEKLIREGVATMQTTGGIADAHANVAQAEFEAGKTRISFDDCMLRGEPPPPPADPVVPAAPAPN